MCETIGIGMYLFLLWEILVRRSCCWKWLCENLLGVGLLGERGVQCVCSFTGRGEFNVFVARAGN